VLAGDENQVSGEQGTLGYDGLRAAGASAYVLGNYCLDAAATPSVDVVYDDVRELGALFGVSGKADEVVAGLRARVDRAAALRGDRAPLRVAFVQSYGGRLFALSGSYYAAILQAAGLTNEFADVGQNFAEVSAEQVLARQPEAVFVLAEKGEDPQQVVAATRSMLAGTVAARDGRVYPLSSPEIAGGGVAIVDQIERAAQAAWGS
uniref:ABC transporter substrate-binding protein n=1 Tax=Pseudonocardia pini TaxID=2758030 RepID=UPI0015F05D26